MDIGYTESVGEISSKTEAHVIDAISSVPSISKIWVTGHWGLPHGGWNSIFQWTILMFKNILFFV